MLTFTLLPSNQRAMRVVRSDDFRFASLASRFKMSTIIEAFGSTSLLAEGNNYFLQPNGGSAVELSFGGAPVVAGQFGNWVPIGAEQTANGYEVAWKVTGADQFTVWNT